MCNHKRIICVNCDFFCLDCGVKIENTQPNAEEAKTANQPETKPTKRRGAKSK